MSASSGSNPIKLGCAYAPKPVNGVGPRRVWYKNAPLPVMRLSNSESLFHVLPPSIENTMRGPAGFRFDAYSWLGSVGLTAKTPIGGPVSAMSMRCHVPPGAVPTYFQTCPLRQRV